MKAVTVVATDRLGRTLFGEGVDLTTGSRPTFGTVTSSVVCVWSVTTGAPMDTKRDCCVTISIIILVSTHRCRLVLTRRAGVIKVGIIIVGVGTIAHHLDSLGSIFQRKIRFVTLATIETIKVITGFSSAIGISIIMRFVSNGGLWVFALEPGESVKAVAALCRVIVLACSSIDTKQIGITGIIGAIGGGLELTKLSGKRTGPLGRGAIAMILRLCCQTIVGGHRGGHTGTSMITLIVVSTVLGGRLTEGSAHTGRTETPHVVNGFGTPYAMKVRGFVGGEDADDTHAVVLTVQGTRGNGACFEFAVDTFPSGRTQTRSSVGVAVESNDNES
jgi:hypothetical protein